MVLVPHYPAPKPVTDGASILRIAGNNYINSIQIPR